jgi:hypothetical protein
LGEVEGVGQVKMADVLRATALTSLFLAAISVAIAAAIGQLSVGLGLAAGMAIGSSNGYLMVATINQRAPFVPASVFRLVLLTGAALMVATTLHWSAWAVALGVGIAQLVMAAAAVREGLRSW